MEDNDGFKKINAGKDTTKMRKGSVEGLVKHPARFNELLDLAEEYVPSVQVNKSGMPAGDGDSEADASDEEDAFNAVDPSSEPSYDM